jgi:hypothetical protein
MPKYTLYYFGKDPRARVYQTKLSPLNTANPNSGILDSSTLPLYDAEDGKNSIGLVKFDETSLTAGKVFYGIENITFYITENNNFITSQISYTGSTSGNSFFEGGIPVVGQITSCSGPNVGKTGLMTIYPKDDKLKSRRVVLDVI